MTILTDNRLGEAETSSAGAQPPDARGLVVRGLVTTFGRGERAVEVVRGASFDLQPGRSLVILGESGSGKSVTARAVMRLLPTTATTTGTVLLHGEDMLGMSSSDATKRRGRRIALVPQDPAGALSPLRRVGAQIAEVLRVHGMVTDRHLARTHVLELLARVGIPDPARMAKAYPHELSGGMRQRVAIAIAIACDPDVLVADEPTTALDVTVQAQILDLFEELIERLDMALLLVTHDVGVAERMADEVAVMYAGRIVEQGPAEGVLANPSHPYTAALLRALPQPHQRRGELEPIPGQPPSPAARPSGCPFRVRCERAVEHCATIEPTLAPTSAGAAAACHAPIVVRVDAQAAG